MALPEPWFIQPTYPAHWYDALPSHLPLWFSTDLWICHCKMSECVPFLSAGRCRTHTIQLLEAAVGGNGLDFVGAVAVSLIKEQIMKSRFACTMGASVIVVFFSCMPVCRLVHVSVRAMVLSGPEREKAAIQHKISFVSIFLFFTLLTSSNH